jgi:hypothetical protein
VNLALKFEYWYQNRAEFYAKFKTVEKNAKKIAYKNNRPKKCGKVKVCPFL